MAMSPVGIAVDKLAIWREHPDRMVRDLFGVTPDGWQDKALQAFPHQPRHAMKASKGPGKTALLSWCSWNVLLCYPNPNIAACSINSDNLRDNLWKEMSWWMSKAPILRDRFTWQTERIFCNDYPATWFMSARAWSRSADPIQLGNTLAGLHADYVMFVIDESGSIPPAIVAAAEAGLSSAKKAWIIQAGNTNTLEGALYEACVRNRHLWNVIEITGDPDRPDRSTRVDIEWAREVIRTWGRDNPFVKVMVLGEWPAASVNALLGPEDIQAAQRRQYQQRDIDPYPKIYGVDVGLFGDDPSVIFPRQGLVGFAPKVLMNVTGLEGASAILRSRETWPTDAIFVDCTGGYGQAWIEGLKQLNLTGIPVGFSEKANKPGFVNKRAQMHWDAAQWVLNGGALPDDPELMAEATATTYTYKGDQMIMEPKLLVKAKIGRSPNKWDSFCLTHAEPVALPEMATRPQRQRPQAQFDPFSDMMRAG